MRILPIADPSALAVATPAPGWEGLQPVLWLLALAGLGFALYLWWRTVRVQQAALELAQRQAEIIGELRDLMRALASERADIDLKRIEHVLIDVRDGQARAEDALLRAIQRPREEPRSAPADRPPGPDDVLERIVDRALALGYDRVQVVSNRDELGDLGEGRHEIALEARRTGVLFKGKAVTQDGRVADLDLQPPYAMFP